ncbi:MAG: radical SAM protein [Firmicutes bacterium]|nr:radical SAM protein [Bacillota bacterium]
MKSSSDLYSFASINKTLTAVTIELNTSCNWRCKHCYIDDFSYEYELSIQVLDKLFQDLRAMGVVDILLTGGEMFMRKDIVDILKLARSYFFDVSLFTNVSLIDIEKIKAIKELFIDHISCTLFSLDECIHDNVTGVKGSLQKVLNNLNLLRVNNINVEVKHIITNLNQNEYEKIVEYCNLMGFKYRLTPTIWSKRDNDREPLNFKVSEDYLRENILKIDDLRNTTIVKKTDDLYICNATRYSCSILANGDVNPCTNLNVKIGNILENNIRSIRENSEYLNWVQNLKWSVLNECKTCDVSEYCMRCGGISLIEHGDLLTCNKFENTVARIRSEKECGIKRNVKVGSTIC